MKTTSYNKNKFLLVALFSSIIAIGIHIYLTLHFYEVKFGLGQGGSVCNINDVFNCDAVTASRYSSFLGLPVALWGVFTNLILSFFIFITYKNLTQDTPKTSRYSFLIATIILIASVVMGTISLTAMSNLCAFCITTYVLSVLSFSGTFMGTENLTWGQIKEDLLETLTSERWVLGFLLTIPVASFGANLMYLESHGLGEVEKIAHERVATWQISTIAKLDLSKGLIIPSRTEKPVMTIVEYADFRCPHCKHASPSLHAFVNSHHDVELIFKPYPLDGTCNNAMKGGGDGISCGLAYLVMCAEKLEKKGWQAHDFIFENQSEITQAYNLEKNIETVSQSIGISKEELKKCIGSEETIHLISEMANEGTAAQVQGTPAIFVNGKLLSGGQMLPVLDAAYKVLKF